MLFYYKRELVGEGEIHKRYDDIEGVPLRDLLNKSLPLSFILFLYAGIADIITAAHDEGLIHGDLCIDDIYVNQTGVIVNGFGENRNKSKAPEGQPIGSATDVYGLGILLFVLLSYNPDFYPMFRDEDSYNQEMIIALINLNWAELSEQDWLEKIQEFFLNTISVEPQNRPTALNIANITHGIIPHCHSSDFFELLRTLLISRDVNRERDNPKANTISSTTEPDKPLDIPRDSRTERENPKERLKKAKEFLELGLMSSEEFEALRQSIFLELGLAPQTSKTAPVVGYKTRVDNGGFDVGGVTSVGGVAGSLVGGETVVGSALVEVGQYRLLELIGVGGMGSVYRGRHKNTVIAEVEGDVAIKLIKPELARDSGLRARFVKEAALGKKIVHPNIAKVLSYHEDATHTAFIMEYIKGDDLQSLILAGDVCVEEALVLLRPLSIAIDYLHSVGVIHRDLKPSNIKIRADGSPVILDFGIAKEENVGTSSMTKTGVAMGTEAYMAPEQLDAKYVGPKADQYSFSMIVYELLSGRLPWPPDTTGTMIAVKKMTNALSPLRDVSSVDSTVCDVVMRGLSLHVADRFESCVVLIDTLDEEHSLFLQRKKEEERECALEAARQLEERHRQEEERQALERAERARQLEAEARLREECQLEEDRIKRSDQELSYRDEQARQRAISRSTTNISLSYGGVFGLFRSTADYPFVEIPSGWFMMGALDRDKQAKDDERPRHKVTISRGFWLGQYPVTQGLYEAVMGVNPSYFHGASRPVEYVSWCDAVLFCNRLSEKEGLEFCYELPIRFRNNDDWSKKVKWNLSANGYRLPTEAEWEYAARGGEDYLYSGSDNIDEVAWYDGNSSYGTHLVGQKKSNGFRLYDMGGDVYEWCWDSGLRRYTNEDLIDPRYVNVLSSSRIGRGSGWGNSSEDTRVSCRDNDRVSKRAINLGFRIVRWF